MKTTLKDVAKECGVSLNTVSDILNRGRENLYRQEMVDTVRKAAAKLQYRPNRAAQGMRTQRSGVVGFIAPNMMGGNSMSNHQVYPFLVGASHYLIEQGQHLALMEFAEFELESEKALPDALRERFLDGLIIHYGASVSVRESLESLGIPVIWWDSNIFEDEDCIYRDEENVGRDLTMELIRLGHRRIGFCGYRPQPNPDDRFWHFSSDARHKGYADVMNENGLEPISIPRHHVDLAVALKETKATAVITLGAGGHLELMTAAAELGLKVPADLSVATCDLEARLMEGSFRIGGILYDRYETGREAARMLWRKIQQPDSKVSSVTVRGQFHTGESVAAAPLVEVTSNQ